MPDIRRIGDLALGWGEGVAWDEQRGRLYFVDRAIRSAPSLSRWMARSWSSTASARVASSLAFD
jgi:hypothetical protein